MSEPKSEEWAIKDEATSEWLTPLGTWSEESAWRTSEYQSATAMYVTCVPKSRFSARIVPAPPREMIDEEYWQWFHDQPLTLSGSKRSMVWDVFHYAGDKIAWASTPIDAIRAARRALEKKL